MVKLVAEDVQSFNTVRTWEVEFECDDSWSITGIYSFIIELNKLPNESDIARICGVRPNEGGLGRIVRIIDVTDDLDHMDF